MPQWNKPKNPARERMAAVLRGLQEPGEGSSPLGAAILGGIGGSGEALLDFLMPEDLGEQMATSLDPAGAMVKMPKALIPKFAKNFRGTVPHALAKEGHPELANYVYDLSKKHPGSFGQLQEMVVDKDIFNQWPDTKDASGFYQSNMLPEPAGLDALEELADLGFTAPSNNRIAIHPDAPNPLRTFKHEGIHLAEDIKGLLPSDKFHSTRGGGGTYQYPYLLRPVEVRARLASKDLPYTPENIAREIRLASRHGNMYPGDQKLAQELGGYSNAGLEAFQQMMEQQSPGRKDWDQLMQTWRGAKPGFLDDIRDVLKWLIE